MFDHLFTRESSFFANLLASFFCRDDTSSLPFFLQVIFSHKFNSLYFIFYILSFWGGLLIFTFWARISLISGLHSLRWRSKFKLRHINKFGFFYSYIMRGGCCRWATRLGLLSLTSIAIVLLFRPKHVLDSAFEALPKWPFTLFISLISRFLIIVRSLRIRVTVRTCISVLYRAFLFQIVKHLLYDFLLNLCDIDLLKGTRVGVSKEIYRWNFPWQTFEQDLDNFIVANILYDHISCRISLKL